MANEQKQNNDNKKSQLKRLITGWVVGVVSFLCLLFGGVYTVAFLLTIVLLGSSEYCKILKHKGFHPSPSIIYIANVIFVLLAFLNKSDLLPFVLTISILASFLVVLFKGRQPYIANVATTALGFLYGGWLPSHLISLRQYGLSEVNFFSFQMNEGLYLVVTVFFAVLVTDIGAYFVGSRHGKRKLCPIISPKKTVEGALGGGICAVLISLTGALYTQLNVWQCALLGLAVTVAAQLGDLSESLIKRDAGVKDSSNILPGHGGFLDRVDGYIFAIPVAYYFVLYFTHNANIFTECFEFFKGILSVSGLG